MRRGLRAAMTRLAENSRAIRASLDRFCPAGRPSGVVADSPARPFPPKMASSTSPRSVIPIVSSTLPRIEGPADAELISAVRGGDVAAYGELFERHVDAARRLARQLVSPVGRRRPGVERLRQGARGPAARRRSRRRVPRLPADRRPPPARRPDPRRRARADHRRHRRLRPGRAVPRHRDRGLRERGAAKAFASLPERWQLVLWHTEVEGNKPADIAPLMGMSANSVAALAYRAREGLRQAFLTMHAGDLDEDACRFTHQNLGAYVRNGRLAPRHREDPRTTSASAASAWRSTSSSPRSTRTSPASSARSCWAAPPRRTSPRAT